MDAISSAPEHSGLSRRSALRRLGGAGAVAAAAVVAPVHTEAAARATAADRHEALVRRLFAVLNGGILDELDALIAPEHIFHACGRPEPIVGRAALKELLGHARAAHQDAPFVLASTVANGEQVAARWTRQMGANGPESGDASEGIVSINGQFICHIEDGRLVETWNVSYPQGS